MYRQGWDWHLLAHFLWKQSQKQARPCHHIDADPLSLWGNNQSSICETSMSDSDIRFCELFLPISTWNIDEENESNIVKSILAWQWYQVLQALLNYLNLKHGWRKWICLSQIRPSKIIQLKRCKYLVKSFV